MRRYEVLGDLIEKRGLEVGAEIGVQQGETFKYLLERFLNLKMYAVDTWAVHPDSKLQTYYQWNHLHNELRVKRIAKDTGRGRVLKGDSVIMSEQVRDCSLDFVFIDADHSVKGVLRDIRAWWPKVAPGGVVSGHDWNWPSVAFVLQSLFLPGFLNYAEDHVWWLVKDGKLSDWKSTEQQADYYDGLTRNSSVFKNRRPLRFGLRGPLKKHGATTPIDTS